MRKVFILAIFAVLILAASLVFIPAENFVADHGSIEWAQDATWLKLRKYEIIGRPDELRTWLLSQDGAPGQETAVLFLVWGLDHQDDFEFILNGVGARERPAIVNWLSGMIVERGITNSFLEAFHNRDSQVIQELKSEIQSITYASYR